MPAERVPIQVHLDALDAEERALWDRYVELVDAAGPAELVVTKSRIAFKAERIFTGGFFKGRRLELFFDLPEPVPAADQDERFRAVWEQSRKLWVHRLSIRTVAELDERLGGWLKSSWNTYSRAAAER